MVAKRLHRALRTTTSRLGGLQALCYTLRILQAAPAQQTMTGGSRRGLRNPQMAQTGLTEGLGTAFPQKGVPNSVRQNGQIPKFAGRLQLDEIAMIVFHEEVKP